jgi:hypothetical protein
MKEGCQMNKICKGTAGDIINFSSGEMLIIDDIETTENDVQYLFNRGKTIVEANNAAISEILHPINSLDMFDRYFLEANEYLTTARRFIHDNSIDGAYDNLIALKTMVELLKDIVTSIDNDQ